jgi:hypothetical protein
MRQVRLPRCAAVAGGPHALAYEAVAGEEDSALKPALVTVQEAGGTLPSRTSSRAPASRNAFFKARAPDQALRLLYPFLDHSGS